MNKLIKSASSIKIIFAAAAFFCQISLAAAQGRAKMVNEGFWTNEPYAWYAQPWIWALVAGVIVMIILVITKGGRKSKMNPESEEGTVHE